MFQRTANVLESNDLIPAYGSATSGEPSPLESSAPEPHKNPHLRKLVLNACCGGSFLFGYSISLLNTSMGHIGWELGWCKDDSSVRGCRRATNYEAVINTSLFVGATIGALTSNKLLKAGRRWTILLAMAAFAIGAINTATSGTVQAFFWARLITGFAVGVVSVAVPTYISEMTPPDVRGFYGTHHQMMIVIGIFLAALLGLPMQLIDPIPTGSPPFPPPRWFSKLWWRIIALSAVGPVLGSAVVFWKVFPFETPHWLILQGRNEEAKCVLEVTEGHDKAAHCLRAIEQETNQTRAAQQQTVSLGAAMRNPQSRRLISLGCLLSIGQQVSGINVFMARSSDLLATAGLSGAGPVVATSLIFFLNVLATIPAVLLIERAGRRNLLLWGTAAQTLCLAPAMVATWAAPEGPFAKTAAAFATLGFVISFALAYGPVLWVYLFEMFPTEIKQVASSLAVGCNWTAAIVMVFLSQYMSATANFTAFTFLSLLSFALVYFYIKETRGRALGDSPYVTK